MIFDRAALHRFTVVLFLVATNMIHPAQVLSINELHAERWSALYAPRPGQSPQMLGRYILGVSDLDSYGTFIVIGAGALIAFIVVYNMVIVLALKTLSGESVTSASPGADPLLAEAECSLLAQMMRTPHKKRNRLP